MKLKITLQFVVIHITNNDSPLFLYVKGLLYVYHYCIGYIQGIRENPFGAQFENHWYSRPGVPYFSITTDPLEPIERSDGPYFFPP